MRNVVQIWVPIRVVAPLNDMHIRYDRKGTNTKIAHLEFLVLLWAIFVSHANDFLLDLVLKSLHFTEISLLGIGSVYED